MEHAHPDHSPEHGLPDPNHVADVASLTRANTFYFNVVPQSSYFNVVP